MSEIIINDFHLEDIRNPKHMSNFIINSNYSLLILRLFKYKFKKITAYNINLILQNEKAYIYENNEFKEIGNFEQIFEFLDIKINKILDIVAQLNTKVEKMENQFYEQQNIKNFNSNWFLYKSSLVKINRILSNTDEVFNKFTNFIINKNSATKVKFEDLNEHIDRSYKSSISLLESLDTLHLVYSNYNDEQVQKTIYLLTIVSVVFLPLNLIVGFFGINTTSLPLTKEDGGSFMVFLMLILTSVVSVLLLSLFKIRKKNV